MVKIIDPAGNVLDQTSYQKAKEGQAWAKNSAGIWQWTVAPTQASTNEIIIESIPIINTAVKKASVKKPKASTSSKAKTKAAVAKKTKVKALSRVGEEPALIAAPTPLPTWLLAFLGVLAVLYACYEYRYEFRNLIFKFKKYLINR
jgi:hypothetical protein